MRTRSKALLWVTLVFLVGTGFGATTAFLWFRSEPPARAEGRADRDRGSFVTRMSQQLELDQDQEQKLRAILEEGKQKQKQLDHRHSKELKEIRKETIQQIRAILRPEQIEKLDTFLKGLKKPGDKKSSHRR